MLRRLLLAAVLTVLPAVSAPPLTTIQDVLYKADGTRFNGTLTISWESFQAVDNSDIVSQTTTVKVVDGNLRVQLAPTTASTPSVTYRVKYNSDGRIQFEERWSVPSSTQPLRVKDVRTSNTAAADTSTPSSGPILESGVVGLTSDLGARPLKGPAYAAGAVAWIDSNGMLASVAGAPSDCVRVDGSAGPCGDVSPAFADSETPTGIVDGSNVAFGLSAVPDPASSLAVYRNGILQKVGQDFVLTGSSVQFVPAATPQPGDTLLASFRVAGVGANAPAAFTFPQILCSGVGGTASSTTPASIGSCQIPAGLLHAGDRVEIRFEMAHQGSAGGFSIEADWGSTALLRRDGAAADVFVSGRMDAAIVSNGAQCSWQSWGTVLPFLAGVGSVPDGGSSGLTVNFTGSVAQAGDKVSLVSFAVVRTP